MIVLSAPLAAFPAPTGCTSGVEAAGNSTTGGLTMNPEQADALVFFGATGISRTRKYFPHFKRLPKRAISRCRSSAWRKPAGRSSN